MSAAITTTATETRCLRCGRKLTASTGAYGPKCAAKVRQAQLDEARAEFTEAQQAKADELIRDGGLVPTNREGVYRAVSSDGSASYLVHSSICNCKAGLKGKRCYHLLAARIAGIAARPARRSQRLAA